MPAPESLGGAGSSSFLDVVDGGGSGYSGGSSTPVPVTSIPPSIILQQSADVAVATALPSNLNFTIRVVAAACHRPL